MNSAEPIEYLRWANRRNRTVVVGNGQHAGVPNKPHDIVPIQTFPFADEEPN